ncbi:MAG: hypothetical protein P8Z42_12940, partial [Anaerolineales bacterium]
MDSQVVAVVLGSGIEGAAAELGKYGAAKILVADDAALAEYTVDAYTEVVAGIVAQTNPGVVILGEGAWVEYDDALGVDKAGATNSLCGTHPTGQGEEPWNTTIVRVEKWHGPALEADYTWPHRVPIKEA